MLRPNAFGAAALSVVLLANSACTTGPNGPGFGNASPQSCTYSAPASALFGALLGAALGAAIAGRRDRGTVMALSATGGALLGGSLASYLQGRCEALRAAQEQMSATQLAYGRISIPAREFPQDQQPQNDNNSGITVSAIDASMFAVGSDQLSQSGEADMTRLAQVFASGNRRILIVGHTDATGYPDQNIRLSEHRAVTVARLFERGGIPAWRLYYKGAGDTEPVDTNATDEGRARNRRVDVVELGNEESIVAYNVLRQSDAQAMQQRVENTVRVESVPRPNPAAPGRAPVAPSGPRALRDGSRFDLGGTPVSLSGASLARYVGHSDSSSSVLDALIPAAWADSPLDAPLVKTSCIADRDFGAVTVKSLATGQIVSRPIRDYVPGLYGSSWTKTLNNNLVAITGVAVLSNGGRVDVPPRLLVFTNYRPGEQKPALNAVGQAKAYIGDKGILYRVFADPKAWPLRCADVVFDHANANKVAFGRLYYDKLGTVYAVDFQPTPARLDEHQPRQPHSS